MNDAIVATLRKLLDERHIEYKYFDDDNPKKRHFMVYWLPDDEGQIIHRKTLVAELDWLG